MAQGDKDKIKRDLVDLNFWQIDESVTPPILTRGIRGKASDGSWYNIRVSADGSLSNTDAANFRVSSIGSSLNLGDDASQNRMSAFQTDAANLMMSGRSDDAGLFRVSAIGGTAGDNVLVDGADQTISASFGSDGLLRINQVSGGSVSFDGDAGNNRVSAIQADASNQRVSSFSDDASTFRVSAIGGTAGDNVLVDGSDQTLSASIQRVSGVVSAGANALVVFAQNRDDAGNFRMSAIDTVVSSHILGGSIDNTSFGATQSDAGQLLVSAKSPDAAAFRISAFQLDASNLRISSTETNPVTVVSSHLQGGSIDNTSFAATQTDASNLDVSAKSQDAGTMRVSSLPSLAGYSLATKAVDVSATTTFIAGTASKTTKVYALVLTTGAAGTFKLHSTTAGDHTGAVILSASGGYTLAVNPPAYLFATTSAGEDVDITITTTDHVVGMASYWQD